MEPVVGAGSEAAAPAPGPFELPLESPEAATAPAATGPAPPARAPAAKRVPGVGETIGGALDLAVSGSAGIRRASLYIGFLTLVLTAPAIVLFLGLLRTQGFDEAILLVFGRAGGFDRPEDAISMLRFAAFFAVVGVAAISVEGQIMAATIIGAVATGRPIDVRGALRLSRRVFWSVVAAGLAVGFVEQLVSNVTLKVANGITSAADASTIFGIVVAGLVTMPFAYQQSGIILGGVGAVESLRRSTRLARARWRLAFVVALAGTVLSFVEVFALSAGLDVVLRVAEAAGLTLTGSLPAAVATGCVILVVVIAIGSLLVTIAALVAAPQVYVFVRLTGYSAGLDRVRPSVQPSDRPLRLVSRPMLAVIVLGILAGLAGLISLWTTPAG